MLELLACTRTGSAEAELLTEMVVDAVDGELLRKCELAHAHAAD